MFQYKILFRSRCRYRGSTGSVSLSGKAVAARVKVPCNQAQYPTRSPCRWGCGLYSTRMLAAAARLQNWHSDDKTTAGWTHTWLTFSKKISAAETNLKEGEIDEENAKTNALRKTRESAGCPACWRGRRGGVPKVGRTWMGRWCGDTSTYSYV